MLLNMSLNSVSITGTIISLIAILGIGAISGLFSERSGVFNIAINGMMIMGGLTYVILAHKVKGSDVNQLWIMLVAALVAGLFGLLHAVASIKFKANQIISGTALNLLAPGIAIFWLNSVEKNAQLFTHYSFLSFSKNPNSFAHLLNLPLFLVIGITLIGWFVLYKTPFGLKLRACGENPHALGAAGVNVNLIRYVAVFISGSLAGLAGALFVQNLGSFSGSVNGLGFISLAILIFGRWRIIWVFCSSIFFGILQGAAKTHSLFHNQWFVRLDDNLLLIVPFIIAIIALIVISQKSFAPKAAGQPYDKSKR